MTKDLPRQSQISGEGPVFIVRPREFWEEIKEEASVSARLRPNDAVDDFLALRRRKANLHSKSMETQYIYTLFFNVAVFKGLPLRRDPSGVPQVDIPHGTSVEHWKRAELGDLLTRDYLFALSLLEQ